MLNRQIVFVQRIEAEVEQEARVRLQSGYEKPQMRKASPEHRNAEVAGLPQLSARSLQSSQSEWDDER